MGYQISQLPPIGTCQLTDSIAEIQPSSGGTTYKATLQQVADLINATASVFPYTSVSGSSQSMAINNGYIANNPGVVTFTLPITAAVGSRIEICGAPGSGGWTIAQSAGQSIQVGVVTSTVGVTGSVSSDDSSDSIVIICNEADNSWTVLGGPQSMNLTIV